MRVHDDRYSRDLRSFNLAVRMLAHEARTHTISTWTGLSAERVRKLSVLQQRETPGKRSRRQRGPSPRQLAAVLTSPSLRCEAAAIAGICRLLNVIPDQTLANARVALPNVATGERLCAALELFQDLVPHARLTLEQWILLSVNLADGAEWSIARCMSCPAMVVADRLTLDRPLCEDCQHEARAKKALTSKARKSKSEKAADASKPKESERQESGAQLDLFCVNDNKGSA